MGVRDSWNELGTGGKVLIGLLVSVVVLVVGIVLLIILAAVIGSFVLGTGDAPDGMSSPQISMSQDYDASSEAVEITHEGGDSVDADKLRIETDERTFEWEDEDGTVEPGDSTVVDASPGTTVRVIWNSGAESMVLFRTTTR